MIVLDANILIYAHMPKMKEHRMAAHWLEITLSSGGEGVGIMWQVATAFLRLTTNQRIFDDALDIETASRYLDNLLSHPLVRKIGPTDRHWEVYRNLLSDNDIVADLVMDTRIVAVAIEHNASIASSDRHFRRFSQHVKVINPLK